MYLRDIVVTEARKYNETPHPTWSGSASLQVTFIGTSALRSRGALISVITREGHATFWRGVWDARRRSAGFDSRGVCRRLDPACRPLYILPCVKAIVCPLLPCARGPAWRRHGDPESPEVSHPESPKVSHPESPSLPPPRRDPESPSRATLRARQASSDSGRVAR